MKFVLFCSIWLNLAHAVVETTPAVDSIRIRPTTLPTSASDGEVRLESSSSELNLFTTTAGVWNSFTGVATTEAQLLENLGYKNTLNAGASSELVIDLTQADGTTNPSTGSSAVRVGFNDDDGSYTILSTTAALSLTITQGSTLGHTSGAAHFLFIYLVNNSGAAKLAVSSKLLDEGSLHTTVAEGGAGGADTYSILYSDAIYSNIAIRLIGRIQSNQTVAGDWDDALIEQSLVPFDSNRLLESPQEIVMVGHAGFGSSATKVHFYTTTDKNTGADMTLVNNSTNGFQVTINRDGLYSGSIYQRGTTTNTFFVGLAINATVTTNISSLAGVLRLCMGSVETDAGDSTASCSFLRKLIAGDVITAHGNGAAQATSAGVHIIRVR